LLRQSLLFVSVLRLSTRRVPRAVRPGPVPEFRCGCRQRPMRHRRGRFIIGSERTGMAGTGLLSAVRHLASHLLDGSSR
jgi:hypothetical protein